MDICKVFLTDGSLQILNGSSVSLPPTLKNPRNIYVYSSKKMVIIKKKLLKLMLSNISKNINIKLLCLIVLENLLCRGPTCGLRKKM
jgi:hypothetical protein